MFLKFFHGVSSGVWTQALINLVVLLFADLGFVTHFILTILLVVHRFLTTLYSNFLVLSSIFSLFFSLTHVQHLPQFQKRLVCYVSTGKYIHMIVWLKMIFYSFVCCYFNINLQSETYLRHLYSALNLISYPIFILKFKSS